MTTFKKTFSIVRNVMFAFTAFCLLSRCQDKELQSVTNTTDTGIAAAGEASNVASITISGSNTHFLSAVDCNSCTFVVASGTEVVDGKELGLKAGSVICLNSTTKYGNLSFVNLEGTSTAPITIGNCTVASN